MGTDEEYPLSVIEMVKRRQQELQQHIYIDMDQTTDLMELSAMLEMANFSNNHNGQSIFNFSEATALSMINEYLHSMYTVHHPSTIALICLYIPVFLMSLAGNVLVVFVVIRNPHMRRVKNIFLVNLAISDLTVTVTCVPMVLGQIVFRVWMYGTIMCKITGYVQGVSVTSAIFTLVALSVDRYMAIKTPFGLPRISGRWQAMAMLTGLWFMSAMFIAPILYARQVYVLEFEHFHISLSYCIELWKHPVDRQAYAIFLLIVTYLLPIIIICLCYTQIGRALCSRGELHRKTSDSSSTVMLGRRRVARMLVALVAMFILTWMPYNILSLDIDLKPNYHVAQILPYTLWLGHAHSAANPILYWFLNPSFRHCMRKAVKCRRRSSAGSHYKARRNTASPHFRDILHIDFVKDKTHSRQPSGDDDFCLKVHNKESAGPLLPPVVPPVCQLADRPVVTLHVSPATSATQLGNQGSKQNTVQFLTSADGSRCTASGSGSSSRIVSVLMHCSNKDGLQRVTEAGMRENGAKVGQSIDRRSEIVHETPKEFRKYPERLDIEINEGDAEKVNSREENKLP